MSFFAEARRQTLQRPTTSPGPGQFSAYSDRYALPERHSSSIQCAPFNSSVVRSASHEKVVGPGPGSYNIAPSDPVSLLTINNKQFVISGRERYQSVFTSRSQRFVSNIGTLKTPGPGEYEVSLQPKLQRSRKHKSSSVLAKANTQNSRNVVPSIPKDILGYKQLKNGELIKIQSDVFRKQEPATVGTYNPNMWKRPNGVKWTKGKSESVERLQMADNTNSQVGPGSYEVKTGLIQTSASKTVTSSFKSTTKKAINEAVDEQKVTPGPGSYIKDTTTFVIPQENHFGSKTARFSNPKTSQLGPGAYSSSQKRFPLAKKYLHSAFNSSSRKAMQMANNVSQVGPGSYELLRKPRSKAPIIGFQERFLESRELWSREFPGPGEYDGLLSNRPKTTAIMRPGTRPMIAKQDQIAPTATSYTVENFNISKRLAPTTASSSQETKRHPFNSTADRFKHESSDGLAEQQENQLRAAIGKLTDRLVIRETSSFQKQVVPFNTTTERQIFPEKPSPGPTYYDKPSNLQWVRQSFNIKGAHPAPKKL